MKGSSISWVAKLQGDKTAEWKLSNGSRSYREIKLLLVADPHPNPLGKFMAHLDFWTPLRFLKSTEAGCVDVAKFSSKTLKAVTVSNPSVPKHVSDFEKDGQQKTSA